MSLPAPARGAIAGALHGVAEWLPVSSSGHVALLIEVAGWPESAEARRRERRALEVALHTGSLGPIGARVAADLRAASRPGALLGAGLAATALTSVIGATAGPVVERRASGPAAVAVGLVAGSLALLAAERRGVMLAAAGVVAAPPGASPSSSSPRLSPAPAATGPRPLAALTPADVVVVGIAQGLAIWPGVSRRAATLAAARARGLDPVAADTLSWATGLPTLAAATIWQFWRTREAMAAAPAAPLAGAMASAGVGWLTRGLPARTAAWPARRWAAWRVALAAATLRRR